MNIIYFLFFYLLYITASCYCLFKNVKDPYKILGLSRNEFNSNSKIKRAYKDLAKKWHPDRNKNPEASENFNAIVQAYQVKFFFIFNIFF